MAVEAPLYPVALVVQGRPVLVVGGGPVAARKVENLHACRASVHVIAPEVGEPIRRLPGVSWDERPYRRGDVAGYRLVISATGVPEVDRAVHDDAEAAGVWVNCADDPEHCTFTLPAVARRGPIAVAVSTGGHSPALAAWLRGRFEAELGPEYDTLVDLLAGARDVVRSRGRPTESVDWQSALDSGILDLVRTGRVDEARERLHSWL